MKSLFGAQAPGSAVKKKSAMVFVDFEHWYISLDKMYHKRPDIKGFRDELTERYNIVDVVFFGDFSNPSLRAEIGNIRAISNTIIETQNTSVNFEKDFTDFIMLDHIYQSAFNKDSVEAYVIFTGDGHFSSVVSFLVTKCRKEVFVYAVRDACSKQLMGSASDYRLLPDAPTAETGIAGKIMRSLSNVYDKNKGKKEKALSHLLGNGGKREPLRRDTPQRRGGCSAHPDGGGLRVSDKGKDQFRRC